MLAPRKGGARRLLCLAAAGFSWLAAHDAFAQDAPAPLPPPPAQSTAATPTASAGRANRADNVVVAEPGDNVTVHAASDDRYAPDPTRKAALIASPIIFGVGAGVSGVAYLATRGDTCTYGSGAAVVCTRDSDLPDLVTYDAIVTIVPSVPRWIVGDIRGALIYTALRGAAAITASVIDWGNGRSNWRGPFIIGFLTPVTLGVVDLVTTPHREDVDPQASRRPEAGRGPTITSIAPVAATDAAHHVVGASLQVSASF